MPENHVPGVIPILGGFFDYTTNSGHPSYNSSFTNLLKSISVEWFSHSKEFRFHWIGRFLADARQKRGNLKHTPEYKRRLHNYLARYPKFYEAYRTISPSRFDRSDLIKKNLIERMKSGKRKPTAKSILGRHHGNLMRQEDYRILAEKYWPARHVLIEQKLVELAMTDKSKPTNGTPLRQQLNRFTHPSSRFYKEKFTERIKSIRPDWFEDSRLITSRANYGSLLDIAQRGKPKPHYSTRLGSILRSLPFRMSSDAQKYYSTIKRIRPEWWPRS